MSGLSKAGIHGQMNSLTVPGTEDDKRKLGPSHFDSFGANNAYRHTPDMIPRSTELRALVTPTLSGTKVVKRSWSSPNFRTVAQLAAIQAATQAATDAADMAPQPPYYYGLPQISYADLGYLQAHLRNFITADIPLSKNSSWICPHPHHCLQNAFFKGFFRTLAASYIFKTTVSLAQRLFGGKLLNKDLIQNLRKVYLSEDPMRFSLFIGLMSFTYKAIICVLRRTRQKDPIYHKAIAGFIAAAWCIMDDKKRRKTLAMYLIVRSIGDVLRLGVHRKQLPVVPGFEVACFTGAQLFIMYGLVHAPQAMDPKYYKWVKNMGNLKEEQIQPVFRSRISTKNMYRLPGEPWVACRPTFHEDPSCFRHNTKDWFAGLIRAARIYIPVHFLPMLLFTPKKVFNNPTDFLYRKALNTLRSSVFLTTYQYNAKMTFCIGRNLVRDDPWYVGVSAGFFAGMSLLIEHAKRRGELCMYVVPRAIEIMLRLLPQKMFPRTWKFIRSQGLSIFAFQLSIALWMALINTRGGEQSANALNMTVLRIIFGSKH